MPGKQCFIRDFSFYIILFKSEIGPTTDDQEEKIKIKRGSRKKITMFCGIKEKNMSKAKRCPPPHQSIYEHSLIIISRVKKDLDSIK